MQVHWFVEFLEEKEENIEMCMVSTGRNIGTITQELRYPAYGTVVHFQQDPSFVDKICGEDKDGMLKRIYEYVKRLQ